ncbi:PssD/Cps14F family polysaccharide biosynthesis glycosyltransferase [Enterococcus sp. AZ109]|uniref:PssD/Cps14F family polysaccharide biosynthesis glycosyltransferase n=1 Tax=Enterococcus sp. AZ109 TaxID=2774634 RepID=UPI003F250B0D
MKVCFTASSGGHFQQLMMLEPLMNQYESFIVTEKTSYKVNCKQHKAYYVPQIQRKEKLWLFRFLFIFLTSLKIFFIEKPDVIISTGVLATLPMCFLGKICRKKIIFIESFAKSEVPTLTGRVMVKISDKVYVQWKSMLRFYERATCLGSIY